MTANFTLDPILAGLARRFDDETGYLMRPVAWTIERADAYPHAVQRKILESVRDHRYTAVPSCHDSGKSWVASVVGGWWMDCHPTGSAFLVSTAPTAAQVSAILWRELTRLHERAHLRGRINRAGYPQWYMGPELVGYGRKPSDYDESAFQGIHSEYPLIVIDEAGGIKKHLYDAVDALATNANARVLAIGNPDDPGSYFAEICKNDSDWNVIQIDGLRTPNFTAIGVLGRTASALYEADPADLDKVLDAADYPLTAALMFADGIGFNDEPIPPAVRPSLLSPLWVEERLRRWAGMGKDSHKRMSAAELMTTTQRRSTTSPLVQAKVRGIFPDTRSTGVLPLGWVQQAVNRHNDWLDAGKKSQNGRRVVGVDPAYLGTEGDETAIAVRQGDVIEQIIRYRDADTIETAEQAARYLHVPQSMAIVDVIGIGAGVVDQLRRWRRDGKITADIVQFVAGAQSTRWDRIGALRFRNDRSAMWWNFRELLDPSRGSRIALPDDERLIEELVSVRVTNAEGGIMKVESKAEIRRRLGRSTDSADAVLQSFWLPGESSSGMLTDIAWKQDTDAPDRFTHSVFSYQGYDPFEDADFDTEPDWDI